MRPPWSVSLLVLPLGCALLAACGPAAAPPAAPLPPVAITADSAQAAGAESASAGSAATAVTRAVAEATSPLELVEADGAVIFWLDVAALRDHALYGPVKAVMSSEERKIREATAKCGFHPVDAVGSIAASMHDFHRGYPLVVVRLAVAPKRAEQCLTKLLDEARPVEIGGHRGLRVHDYGGDVAVLLVGDLLLFGRILEVKRALGRRETGRRGQAAQRLVARGLQPTSPLALALETGDEEIEVLNVSGTRAGPRIEVAGEALFRDRRHRTAAQEAQHAARDLEQARGEAQDKLRGLLGKHHPLIAQLDALHVTVQGPRLSASLGVTVGPGMKPALDAAAGRLARLQLVREARGKVGAISRGAVAAFERELAPGPTGLPLHGLCASATDVPARVPRGRLHEPNINDGHDYQTGDERHGWRCLKFSLSQPHAYRYGYRQGGHYKGPARGGPNPGPRGFEVSAEGDLDGDGKTSLFTRTGVVDPAGRLRLSPQIFVVDEYE